MFPRIRTIKPEFFRHEGLYDLEVETGLPLRLAFIGLWCCCDREGRFNWRPKTLKSIILPFDDIDFSRVLDALATRGAIVRYASAGEVYGHIPSWRRHQHINPREVASQLPSIEQAKMNEQVDALGTRESRVGDARGTRAARKGKEGKGNNPSTSTVIARSRGEQSPPNGDTPNQIFFPTPKPLDESSPEDLERAMRRHNPLSKART